MSHPSSTITVVAGLIQLFGRLDPKRFLEGGKQASFRPITASGREEDRGAGVPAGRPAPRSTGGRGGKK